MTVAPFEQKDNAALLTQRGTEALFPAMRLRYRPVTDERPQPARDQSVSPLPFIFRLTPTSPIVVSCSKPQARS